MEPKECSCLEDIRHEIDAIDNEIVKLLGKRLNYVYAASNFKPSQESIPAPERVASMLKDRRVWAHENKISENFIAEIFEKITSWYIAEQILFWKKKHGAVEDER